MNDPNMLQFYIPTQLSFDFHVHTHLSDGDPDQSPDTVCRQAAEAGIHHLSITDHDHALSPQQCRELSMKHHIDVIPGCEFSGLYTNRRTGEQCITHINGHGIDCTRSNIRSILAYNQNQDYEGYGKQYLWNANKYLGLHLSLEEIDRAYEQIKQEKPYSGHTGKRAVARYLFIKQYVPAISAAYSLFSRGGPCWVDPMDFLHFAPYEDVVAAINSHALSSLCHLFYYNLSDTGNQQLLQDAKKLGVQALETVYQNYNEAKRKILFQACKAYDLLPNAGSDRHDDTRPFIYGPGSMFLALWRRQMELHGTWIGSDTVYAYTPALSEKEAAELCESLCPPSLRSDIVD